MTENEAIKNLKRIAIKYSSNGNVIESIEKAIDAIKELHQYRQIGTLEACREAMEKQQEHRLIKWQDGTLHCPNCGYDNTNSNFGVCVLCGQAIKK